MLIVIAAGNSGSGASTVSAPGTAKNCLTVGACESVRPLPATVNINPNMQDDHFNPATPPTNVALQQTNFDLQAGYSWFWYGETINGSGLRRGDASQFYLQTTLRY